MLTRLRVDVSSAFRGVTAGRSASLAAVAALAVGLGASLTAASVAYNGLLRPLPFPNGARLVTIAKSYVPTGATTGVKLDEVDRFQSVLAPMLELTAYSGSSTTWQHDAVREEIRAAYVTDNWFQTMQTSFVVGTPLDDTSAADAIVVTRAFAARLGQTPAAAIGRSIQIGSTTRTVAGILPAGLEMLDEADVWIRARTADPVVVGQTDARWFTLIGRVRPEATTGAVHEAVSAALLAGEDDASRKNWRTEVRSLRDSLLGESRPILIVFLAAAILMLLVCCGNVTLLLVNRSVTRTKEFAIRTALGASQTRLVGVALIETTMLAGVGTLSGWWLARVATAWLASQTGLELPAVTRVIGASTLSGAAAIALAVVVLICGAAPLVAVRRAAATQAMRTAASTASRGHRRLRAVLVIAQLAMTMVLLVGAGLLGRTLLAVSRADLGFDEASRVVTMPVPIGQSTRDTAGRVRTIDEMADAVRRLPGVTAAGIGGALPPVTGGVMFTIRVMSDSKDATREFDFVPMTEGYLDALGARVVQGRLFTTADRLSSEPVVVLSQTAMKHLGLVTDVAIDRPINLSLPTAEGPRVKPRLVGVIADIRYAGLDAPPRGGVYVLWRQIPLPSAFLVARATTDPRALLRPITRVVKDGDPSLPLRAAATPFEAEMTRALAPRTARFGLVGTFAAGAALLGLVGLGGAIGRSVAERQRELAIRAAVGATPARLLRGVLAQAAALTAAGVATGLGLSAAFARAMSTVIAGVSARDPLTYAAAGGLVLIVAAATCLIPARRAAKADPIGLLRAE